MTNHSASSNHPKVDFQIPSKIKDKNEASFSSDSSAPLDSSSSSNQNTPDQMLDSDGGFVLRGYQSVGLILSVVALIIMSTWLGISLIGLKSAFSSLSSNLNVLDTSQSSSASFLLTGLENNEKALGETLDKIVHFQTASLKNNEKMNTKIVNLKNSVNALKAQIATTNVLANENYIQNETIGTILNASNVKTQDIETVLAALVSGVAKFKISTTAQTEKQNQVFEALKTSLSNAKSAQKNINARLLDFEKKIQALQKDINILKPEPTQSSALSAPSAKTLETEVVPAS